MAMVATSLLIDRDSAKGVVINMINKKTGTQTGTLATTRTSTSNA